GWVGGGAGGGRGGGWGTGGARGWVMGARGGGGGPQPARRDRRSGDTPPERATSAGEDAGQESVPELPPGIMPLDQILEIVPSSIAGSQVCRFHGEQLAPVGAGREGRQLLLDQGHQLADGIPFRLPGEVDGQAGPFVAGAHPQPIGVDRAQLRDEQVGTHLV